MILKVDSRGGIDLLALLAIDPGYASVRLMEKPVPCFYGGLCICAICIGIGAAQVGVGPKAPGQLKREQGYWNMKMGLDVSYMKKIWTPIHTALNNYKPQVDFAFFLKKRES